jgi:hypothetical protein
VDSGHQAFTHKTEEKNGKKVDVNYVLIKVKNID